MQIKASDILVQKLYDTRSITNQRDRKAEKRRIFSLIKREAGLPSSTKLVMNIVDPQGPLYGVLRDKRSKLPLDDGKPAPVVAPAVVAPKAAPAKKVAVAKKAAAPTKKVAVAKKAPAKAAKAPAKAAKAPAKAAKAPAKAAKAPAKAAKAPAKAAKAPAKAAAKAPAKAAAKAPTKKAVTKK